MPPSLELTPIGVFHSPQKAPYEAGRQPDSHHAEGVIELVSGKNFEQALKGLDPQQRIWVVFQFHHNDHWNPKVLPPRGGNKKLGVFATRSPYRPNPLGISTLQIVKIDGLKIHVTAADLLDGTPILDIKPYISYADSFPNEEPEWLRESESFQIELSPKALQQLEFLEARGLSQLRSFLLHQLEYEPTNSKKKRVKPDESSFIISYKTWRARFTLTERQIEIVEFFSGYSEADLKHPETDPYKDKALHQEFILVFNS